jgi:DNA polymerase III epsilon subunit-like protein
MKPLFISVDLEFTDGNLRRGQVTQIAFVSNETGRVGQWVLPITTDASVNAWNWENLDSLVTGCLKLGAKVDVKQYLSRTAGEMRAWLYQDQHDALFARLDENEEANVGEEPIPIVMVTWCGGYDFAFTARLFNSCGLPNPFHYEAVDIAGVAYGLGFEWDTSGEDLREALGMEPNPNPHNALADAQHQIEMFRRLQNLRPERTS